MFGFLRRRGGTVRYEQPVAEPHRNELGLAGFCAHGIGMLDACEACEGDDLAIIPGLFPPVPPAVTRQLTRLDDSIERRIRLYDQMIRELRDTGDMRAVDVLLDARNRIRPPRPAQVPVIPGRSS